jgi:hypothetical protein
LKLQYLYAELDESAAYFEEAKAKFGRAYQDCCATLSEDEKKRLNAAEVKSLPVPKAEPPPIGGNKKEIKKLFRDIATETHPDKLEQMAIVDKEFRSGMFEKAKKACEELNWYELSKLAEELKIKIPSLSESQLELLQGTAHYVASQIDALHHTYAWQWYQRSTDDDREEFMMKYIRGLLHP